MLFAMLNRNGIKANIVIGNIYINGFDVFGTTLDTLKQELSHKQLQKKPISLHTWVTLGDDTIIDPALAPRLVKNHGAPAEIYDRIFVNRACEMERINIRYEPLLVGTEFMVMTHQSDPMVLLEFFIQIKDKLSK